MSTKLFDMEHSSNEARNQVVQLAAATYFNNGRLSSLQIFLTVVGNLNHAPIAAHQARSSRDLIDPSWNKTI